MFEWTLYFRHLLTSCVCSPPLVAHMCPGMRQELQRLEAEASIPTGLLLYCPHKDCSSPLLSPEDNSELPRDRMAACPACHRAFCPTCLVTGWHEVGAVVTHSQVSASTV